MVKVFADTSRQSFQIGVACMGLFGLGTLIVILGWALGLGGVVYTTYEFLRGGYGLTLVANIILGVTATWLYTQTPNNGAPGLDTKRKQLLVLLGMSISMFCSDLGGVLLSFYVEFAFILFFLSFGLYPIHALTGFENEPDFASGVPIIAPGVVYVQQPMSVPGQPGVVYTQPAAMDQSGVVYNQPGVAYSQPGVVYNQPSVAYSQPGVAYSQPGVVYSQPGVMYSQPGVAYPPGAINHRGDESMASNIIHLYWHAEPVVTPNVMENIPISNMPPQPPAATSVPLPPSTTPYPQ
ncbi:hypothetical protein BDF19DRAFT_435269 [Syncephalis fuscata]|nr:hypothetical protein BDF19DRAFT_435269 [Syncephalis fuscata]